MTQLTHHLELYIDNQNEIWEEKMGTKGRHNIKKPKQNTAKKQDGKLTNETKSRK